MTRQVQDQFPNQGRSESPDPAPDQGPDQGQNSLFEIYPAIDLLGGQSVRLKKGERASAEVVHPDPLEQMKSYETSGSRWVHVVDLASAFGDSADTRSVQLTRNVLLQIIGATKLKLQVGGGVRSRQQAEALLDLGVTRVVIGTWAVRDTAGVCALAKAYPGRVVVGLDTVGDRVAVQGWTESSGLSAKDFGKRLFDGGVSTALFTEVERDGLLTGIDWEKAEKLASDTGLKILASGGVKDINDIVSLSRCGGVCGVVVGKALAAGTLSLSEALAHQSAWPP